MITFEERGTVFGSWRDRCAGSLNLVPHVAGIVQTAIRLFIPGSRYSIDTSRVLSIFGIGSATVQLRMQILRNGEKGKWMASRFSDGHASNYLTFVARYMKI
jgi:hypothetical protein